MPGPAEPKGDQLNHVLSPLVEELKLLCAGVLVNGMRCRGRLAYVCADLPAARKVLGLNAVTAHIGTISLQSHSYYRVYIVRALGILAESWYMYTIHRLQ